MVVADEILVNELPSGYRFSPTDLELIAYLFLRMLGLCLLGQVVKDIDADKFYANHPSAIAKGKEEEREWYFFIHYDKRNKKEQDLQKYQVGLYISLFEQVFGHRTYIRKREDLIKRILGNIELICGEDIEQQEILGSMEEEFRKHEQKETIREAGNGIGIWKSIGKEDPIYDSEGSIFAFKSHFVYYKRFRNKYKKTHWRMEEYDLAMARRKDQKIAGCVLGRITRGTNYAND